jgi:hypothetical protein
MTDAFTSAKKQYRENSLQYELTGNSQYKQVADVSLQRMTQIIGEMQQELQSYPTGTITPTHVPGLADAERKKKEAQLRGVTPQIVTPPLPDMTWRYVTLGVLATTTVLISMI